jgi:hypothetical protein
MRKLIRSLAAAAAATAALSLIPLALAGAASASTTPAPQKFNSTDWAGYEDVPASGQVVGEAYASFVLPKVNCAKSLIGPHEASAAFRKAHGNDWSAVTYWVGIDGLSGQAGYLEQIGVTAICHSKTSAAVYTPFWQINPRVPHNMTLSFGTRSGVKAGDTIQVLVRDNALGTDPSGVKPGRSYELRIADVQSGGIWDHSELTSGTAPGASADYITEGVSGGPNVAKNAIGLADTAQVKWVHALIATYKSGGADSLDTAKGLWTARVLTMTKALKSGSPVYVTTSQLGQDASGYSTFTNTFVWPK